MCMELWKLSSSLNIISMALNTVGTNYYLTWMTFLLSGHSARPMSLRSFPLENPVLLWVPVWYEFFIPRRLKSGAPWTPGRLPALCSVFSWNCSGWEARQRLSHRGNLWTPEGLARQDLVCIPAWCLPTLFRAAGHHPANSIQSYEWQLPPSLFEEPFHCLLSPIKGRAVSPPYMASALLDRGHLWSS